MLTPDDALLYSVLAQGIDSFFLVRRHGVRAEHLFDDANKVWPLLVTYAFDHQRMPTLNEIRIHYDDPRLLSDDALQELIDNPAKMDPELVARSVIRRNLTKQINEGIDEAADLSNKDPFAARELLLKLADETAWTYGEPDSTKNPSTIRELRASYELAERTGGDLLGYPSPWQEVDARSLGLQKGELTVILAKRKVGKCLEATTVCHDPDTGREVTIEEIVRSAKHKILTWDKNKPIHSVAPAAYVDTGTKECLKITWRSGRTLIGTPEHPLMTPTGWQRLDQLVVGNHTAAAAQIPEPRAPLGRAPYEIKLVAYMIAEGGCTKSSTPTFTSTVDEIVQDMSACLGQFQARLAPIPQREGNYNVVRTFGTNNRVVDLLADHGILGKRAIHKTIPDAIFSLSNDQLAIFLGRLWSCDGTVEKRGQVSYSTGSRKLADQVQHLLLRFGVTSHVRICPRETKDGLRDYYEVVLHRERIERFKLQIGPHFVGPKADRLQKVTFQGRSRVGWLRNEELREQIVEEIDANRALLPDVGEELGYSFKFQKGHVFDSKSGRIRKKVFSAFVEVYDSPLRWVLDENIQWDAITKIEPVGEQRVFDLTVDPTHCFVANDVIVHNTWVKLAWADHIYSLPAGHPWKLDGNDKIMFITLEMPKRQVYRRWTAIHLNLPYAEFRAGDLTSHQKKRFTDWCDLMEKGGTGDEPELLVLDSNECPTVHDLGILIAEHKPKVVFVDGFYIFKRKGSPGQWEKTLANVEDLKRVCTKTDVPIVASTQIKGSTDGGALNATSDDAAYAKAIGDYADAVRGLFANQECIDSNVRYWRGLETREFIPADVLMHFDLQRMHFNTIEEIEPGFVRDEHAPKAKKKGGKKDESGSGGYATAPSASPAAIMGGDDDDDDILEV